MAGAWRLIVDFAIPPALVLTLLVMLPMPKVARKGMLSFTRRVLHFEVLNGCKLVYLMCAVTAAALAATSIKVHQVATQYEVIKKQSGPLTPNKKAELLANKWHHERNFWIACVAFLSWAFVSRSYQLLVELVGAQDRVRALEAQLGQGQGQQQQQQQGQGPAGGAPAPVPVEPRVPPQDPRVKKVL